ncbi:MAG: GNAT family N-acetyltransferase [Planctomycetaceae bacterium]
MANIIVRPAQQADWQTIADFNIRLAWETEEKQLDPEIVGPGVRAVLADPTRGRYFVACQEEQIVGQLMHTKEWSDWRNGDIWWLQSVYVAEKYRRRGVFRSLLAHLINEAEADPQIVGIRLYVETDNQRAHQTYEKLGLTQAGYFVMERIFPVR